MRQEKRPRGNFLYLLVIYTVVQEYIVEIMSYGFQVFHIKKSVCLQLEASVFCVLGTTGQNILLKEDKYYLKQAVTR